MKQHKAYTWTMLGCPGSHHVLCQLYSRSSLEPCDWKGNSKHQQTSMTIVELACDACRIDKAGRHAGGVLLHEFDYGDWFLHNTDKALHDRAAAARAPGSMSSSTKTAGVIWFAHFQCLLADRPCVACKRNPTRLEVRRNKTHRLPALRGPTLPRRSLVRSWSGSSAIPSGGDHPVQVFMLLRLPSSRLLCRLSKPMCS